MLIPSVLRKPLGLTLTISLLLNVLLWAAARWLLAQEGPATLAGSSATLPAAGLVVLIGNALLAFLLRKTSPRAEALLAATALATQVILLVSLATLWRLNQ